MPEAASECLRLGLRTQRRSPADLIHRRRGRVRSHPLRTAFGPLGRQRRNVGGCRIRWRLVTRTLGLPLSRDYFRLRKGLERRLYELARKHCGLQAKFTIRLDTLLKKSGAMCSMKEFRRQIRVVVASNVLPDYSLELDASGDALTIWTRDGGKRLRRMIAEVQQRGISTLDGILA